MRLEHYPEEKLKREILEIVDKYLDLKKYKVFIFGSRVSGSGDDRSDIDIGIEGSKIIPNEIKYRIKDEIETIPVLYKFDVIDFTAADENFKKVAKQHIEIINPSILKKKRKKYG
ncbi:MAG: hypothetical protein A2528_00080 [Candidatus Staskawiczbacteria bacterium RIFOXYD2_FULL_37_9]|uniref:Polymerase beta nucleotidyltransferase domain-containing protein n=1 Tax=Candidatus Staskawiczbacteria bacterium RIFOXYB1_FULL_37_44 TaxID=1802223 RepID=A0A1G2ITW2_9BACT|nr:MAG: hypothetical protein A2358_02555 [Candidatus Staskawiczbacteria bacterium RIFOXYB1_FULL_37_44]OGZ84286.1 MAG: hypothetical protein A2416_01405 [Candidatus Staskawiczbacteria bacterium RIFOXYC1_FULL_37_52]OGZ89153.1 MAG: hypothetical protein A2581_01415 [Candidatus Staskawiczbacteria bacterium RIFOXYD1_FULL_37_110]OGZ89436.1 MAG: hypothetical protein A2444_04035 [Candidatus Staskawiczbacteria bacterium RIFOXYC2_FULL_37_19]OGZ94685.1 MAG: hypothetical protein A2528_00080 [Candidatus Stask